MNQVLIMSLVYIVTKYHPVSPVVIYRSVLCCHTSQASRNTGVGLVNCNVIICFESIIICMDDIVCWC